MNFVGHMVVAGGLDAPGAGPATGPGPARALGAALPDLAPLAGLRFDPAALPRDLRQGVACHHQTDRAFHRMRAFTTGARQLRTRLEGVGLPAGASRAVGHAGWELLLDGCLARRPSTRSTFDAALDRYGEASAAFDRVDRDRWATLARQLAAGGWWEGADDPQELAGRLHRALSRRPRLAFPVAQVDQVAVALAEVQPAVERDADEVVAAVVAAVSAEQAATARLGAATRMGKNRGAPDLGPAPKGV